METVKVVAWFGGFFHVLSALYISVVLIKNRSCGNISGKTQMLLAITSSTRDLDGHIPVHSFGFRITCLICYYLNVILIFSVLHKSYKRKDDTFLTEALLVPSFLLALWFNDDMTQTEMLKSFSIVLETVAILPQFYMIYKRREADKNLLLFVLLFGLYKQLYLSDRIYSYLSTGHYDKIWINLGIVYVFSNLGCFLLFCLVKIKVINDTDMLEDNVDTEQIRAV